MAVLKYIIYVNTFDITDESCYYFLHYLVRNIPIYLFQYIKKYPVNILKYCVFLGEILPMISICCPEGESSELKLKYVNYHFIKCPAGTLWKCPLSI